MKGPASLAQANTRTASNTEITPTGTLSVAVAQVPATHRTGRYIVQPGDTLSGIAARFAVRGGWPALYAANRRAIGPDPNVIHAGIVLRISHSASSPAGPARRRHPSAPQPSRPAIPQHHPHPSAKGLSAGIGMPQWLKTFLLALGLLILLALFAASVVVVNRRRQQATARALRPRPMASTGHGKGFRWPIAVETAKARIVFADHDRLVVTRNRSDDTICVLRPPGEDPEAILRVARLVLPEEPYRDLAAELGMPPSRTEE
jgi:LysM domain